MPRNHGDAMKWCRLYAEFALDPKVQSMPEAMQRRLCMLFCLQTNEMLKGIDDDELAATLRITTAELQKTKTLFRKKGFIDDTWELKNWHKRQFSSDTSAERTRRYRHRIATGSSQNVTGDVTVTATRRHSDGLEQNRADTERETNHAGAHEDDLEPFEAPSKPTNGHPAPHLLPPADRAEIDRAAAFADEHFPAAELGLRIQREPLPVIGMKAGWWIPALRQFKKSPPGKRKWAYLLGIIEGFLPDGPPPDGERPMRAKGDGRPRADPPIPPVYVAPANSRYRQPQTPRAENGNHSD